MTTAAIDRSPIRRCAVLVSVLALSMSVAAGCGSGESSESEEDRVKQTVNRWEGDLVSGDGKATCSGLTEAGREELLLLRGGVGGIPMHASCPETVRWIRRGGLHTGARPRPPTVRSVRIDGDRAVAQVAIDDLPPTPVHLAKQDGDWKVASAGFGSPLHGGERAGDSSR